MYRFKDGLAGLILTYCNVHAHIVLYIGTYHLTTHVSFPTGVVALPQTDVNYYYYTRTLSIMF